MITETDLTDRDLLMSTLNITVELITAEELTAHRLLLVHVLVLYSNLSIITKRKVFFNDKQTFRCQTTHVRTHLHQFRVSVANWLQLTHFFIPDYIRPEFKFPVQHLRLIFLPF